MLRQKDVCVGLEVKQHFKNKDMKRYECRMDDGEFLKSFNQLKDARKYRSENNFNYISRSIVIYDTKKNVYLY